MGDERYHQQLREEKRLAVVDAAMALFLDQGYERTSLAQIAKRAAVSTATLFKRYPTKAALLEAIVERFWAHETAGAAVTGQGTPRAMLRAFGLDYGRRMRRPEIQALYRLIIAETPRFPDLGRLLFDKGKGAFLADFKAYLASADAAGELSVDDAETAALQFLGLVSARGFWPELLGPGCGGDEAALEAIVDDAVAMMLARYAVKA